MSVQFRPFPLPPVPPRQTPCLCAQMVAGEVWSAAMQGNFSPSRLAALEEAADPSCVFCGGTGVEMAPGFVPELDLANDNAHVFLAILGLGDNGGLMGEAPLPEARRALMRGRSRDLSRFTRPDFAIHGGPRDRGDGVVELHPLRWQECGLTEERLRSYLDRWEQLVRDAEAAGATCIRWA